MSTITSDDCVDLQEEESANETQNKDCAIADSPSRDEIADLRLSAHARRDDPAAAKSAPPLSSFFRRKQAEMSGGISAKNVTEEKEEPLGVAAALPVDPASTFGIAPDSRLLHEEEEEECGIDMGELIPNLENFDPAILSILPARARYSGFPYRKQGFRSAFLQCEPGYRISRKSQCRSGSMRLVK
jgi:hypothetical protein